MQNNHAHALERVMKARAALIFARRFYGVLVSHVEPVISDRVPTAATDGKRHYWNPDFVEKLTQAELEFVQAHETEHDARHHGTRRGSRDMEKWNIAGDLVINPDLIAEGFTPPKGILFEERFRGMSAEDVYRIRELEEQQQNQQQPESSDDAEQGDEELEDDAGQDKPNENEGEPGDDGEAEKPEKDQGEHGDDDSSQEGDETEEPGTTKSAGDDETSTDDDGDSEAGNGSDGDQAGDTSANGGGGGEPSDEEGEPNGQPKSCGDPGGCGEVLDTAEDATDVADADQKWERIVRQAASMAKAIGQLPGHVTAQIEAANNPPQDWREQLRAWIDNGTRRVETWNRPNRRVISQGLILPSSQKEGVNKIACVIDTSGSMDDIALGCIRTELQAALDDHAADEIVAIYNDTRVTRVDHFVQGDELIFDPRGRGGTDLRPAFNYVAEELGDVSGMLVFTDLFIGEAGPEPECPVLFAVYGYPQHVRENLANTPWNAPGIDCGVR
jgi:predicted metal-dependent peptidase